MSAGEVVRFKKGELYERITDPVLLFVTRVRIAGRATRRVVPVQTWLGGERWGKIRFVRPARLAVKHGWYRVGQ